MVVLQAIIGSISIHLIYIVFTMGVGYIKTRNFRPDFEGPLVKGETLQNDLTFGKVTSPYLYLFTIVGVAIILGIAIITYKSLLS